jgi:hypothetical protein
VEAAPPRPGRPRSRIASALRRILASVWFFVIPKEPWGVLCVWPTLFLATASYAWAPSDLGKRLILLAFLWDSVMGIWLMLSAMKTPRDALTVTVLALQDCTYTPIGWDRILTRDGDAAMIERWSLMSFLRRNGLSFDHLKAVRVFRVGMGDSGAIPDGLGVFNVPFAQSVILVRDDPDDAEIEDRFCLYHELGHTLGHEFALQSALRKGVTLPFLALVLAAVAVPATRTSLLVLALCLVGLAIVRAVFVRHRKSLRAVSEMKADEFAIDFMKEDEKRYVLGNTESVLPRDSGLSRLEHLARVGAARSYIETGVSAVGDRSLSQVAYLWEAQLPALNLGAWMILLAGFIGAPSPGVVHGFQWLIAATFAVLVLRYATHYSRGMLLERIFIGEVAWENGRFRPHGRLFSADSAATV